MSSRAARPFVAALALVLAAAVAFPVVAHADRQGDAPPPTPVAVPGGGTSPSPFPTALRTPPPSASAPQIAAASAVLVDLESGQILLDQDGGEERPIASLTKLMTALLVLRRTQPQDVVTVSADAALSVGGVGISELGLETGERITVEQLLYALLLQSANDAAVALAEHVSGSLEAFVKAMNAQAKRLGMRHTRFYSPNGLDDRGYSTALDLIRVTRADYAYPLFQRIATTRFHDIPAPEGPPRVIQNRNVLLWLYRGAIGGKTGFTSAAGFCVVAAAQREGIRLAAVVLGAPGEPFSDAAELLNYGFAAFDRKRLVQAGEPFDTIEIQGHEVAIAAARDLDALVPADSRIDDLVVSRPGIGFPPNVGEVVATLRVSAGDLRLRSVPLVATRVPPPPPPAHAGPWWLRAAGSMVHAVSSLLSAVFG